MDEQGFVGYRGGYPFKLGQAPICLVELLEDALRFQVARQGKRGDLVHHIGRYICLFAHKSTVFP